MEPDKPIISKNNVEKYNLNLDDIVLACQDDDQWEGKVSYDEETDTWYIELMEETYRDLSFPPQEFSAFSKMNDEEAECHFQWFLKEIENRITIFKNTYQAFTEREKDRLNFTEESLVLLGRWINELTHEILGEDDLIMLSEYGDIDTIKNAVDWFKQAAGKNISNVNPGYIELMLDTALYYSKVLEGKFPSKWAINKEKIPVLIILIDKSYAVQVNPFKLTLTMFQKGQQTNQTFQTMHKKIIRKLEAKAKRLNRSNKKKNDEDVTLEVISGVQEF